MLPCRPTLRTTFSFFFLAFSPFWSSVNCQTSVIVATLSSDQPQHSLPEAQLTFHQPDSLSFFELTNEDYRASSLPLSTLTSSVKNSCRSLIIPSSLSTPSGSSKVYSLHCCPYWSPWRSLYRRIFLTISALAQLPPGSPPK